MNSDEELERLAGQLRAAAAVTTEGSDDAIPMLTEVVEVPRYDVSELPGTLTAVDWSQLALRVQENVLERMLNRSEALLDAQLRANLQAVIGRAAESLAADLGTTLEQLIRDLVARAVTEELTRVHDEVVRVRSGHAPDPR
jgi:molybdopterin converting factor small subunit